MKTIFLTLLLLLSTANAKSLTDDELQVAFVYKLSKNILWNDTKDSFTIHVVTSNKKLLEEFHSILGSLKLHNKKIKITSSTGSTINKNANVIYIDAAKGHYYKKIFLQTRNQPVLLISDSYDNKKIVLLNLFKTDSQTINFEVNKANILTRNLKIKPNLVLLGGTELDVAYLYKEVVSSLTSSNSELKQAKKNVEEEKKKLIQMQNNIKKIKIQYKDLVKKEIEKFNTSIKALELSVSKKNREIAEQNKKIKESSDELKETEKHLKNIKSILEDQTGILEKEQKTIITNQRRLIGLEHKITKKLEEFNNLKKKTLLQSKQLTTQEETINTQKIYIFVAVFCLLLFIVVALIISNLLTKQRHTNKLLSIAEEELQTEKQKAEKANSNKSIFIANMSHELRTPLNAVLGYTELLQKDKSISGKHQKKFQIIKSSGEHLLNLINDILLISKMEAGGIEIHNKVANLHDFLDNLYSTFILKTTEKNIYLQKHYDENLPKHIIIDIDKMRQIFTNLLNNAVKFTKKGGINIYASVEENYLVIKIEDSGYGIGDAEVDTIFQQYTQSKSGKEEGTGTGLGLAMVQKFTNLLDGEVTVESILNVGTTFSVKLPYKMTDETMEAKECKNVVALADNQSCKILVVDDILLNRTLLQEMLGQIGFKVELVTNGLEAVESVKISRPDIILMDLKMPVMGGKEASSLINKITVDKPVPIIGLTASIINLNKYLNKPEPFSIVMSKPFHENELLENIKNYLKIEYVYELEEKRIQKESVHNQISFEMFSQDERDELLNIMKSMNITLILKSIDALDDKYKIQKEHMKDLVSDLNLKQLQELLGNT